MTNQTRRRRIRVPLMGTTPFSAEEVALTPFALANRGASAEELEAARRPPTPFSGSIANVGRFLTTGSTEAFQPTTPAGRLGPVGEFATGMVERFPQAFRGAYGKDEPQDREVRALIAEQERRGRALTPQEVGNVLRSVQRPTTTAREIGRAFTAPRSLEDIERTMAGEHGRLAQVLEPLNAIPPVAGALDPIEFVLRAQAARQTAQAVARTGAQAGREAVRQAPSVIGEGVQRFGADVLGQEPPAPVALPSRAAPRRKAQAAPPAATAAQAPTPPPAAAPAVAQPSPPPQPFQEYQGGQIAPATGRQVQGTPGAAPLLQPFAPPSLLPVPAQPTAITTPPPAAVTSAAAQPPPPAALLGGGGTPPTVPPAAAGQAAPPPGNVPPVPPASTLNAPTPPPTGRGFALEPFPDPGARLLGQDTALAQRIRNTFGAKQVVGLVKRADMERDNAAAVLSFQRNIYRESQASRAHAAVLEWLNEAKETLGFDSRGIARKVQPANPGISGKLTGTIYDLVEYPERYILTPQQDNTIRRAQAIMESVLRSEQQAGITIGEVQNYWPRQVIGGPKSKTLQQLLQQLLQPAGKGASTGHTRGRIFPFAEDTVNEGYKINIDPGQTLYRRLEAGIDALANREALNRLSTLPGARGGFDPTFYERLVRVGTILPEEVAGQVYKWLGDVPGLPGFVSGRSISSEMFQLWRNIMVVFDLGATFLQGQALLYRNPVAWWRAQAAGVQAIVAQPVRYVAKNIDVIDEGIRMGAIRPPSEFLLQDTGLSSVLPKSPVVGFVAKRINRHLEWSVFVGQTEMYKAARGVGKSQEELVGLGKAIRRMFGSESYAILGIPRTQQAVEAWLFFAPRFYRGFLGVMAQAALPGPGSNEARRIMGSLLGGATALTFATHYASTRELPNYTDPTKSDWARAKVGDSYISFYGPFHSYFQAAARASYYSAQGEPERGARQLASFLKSKSGIPFRTAHTAGELYFKGESRTFDGEVIRPDAQGALTFLREQVPISLANVAESVSRGAPERAALEIFGTNIRPEGSRDLAARYEQSRELPPANTPLSVLRTAYQQAGEGLLSDAGKKAWREYEPLRPSERKLKLQKFPLDVQREVRSTEKYRTNRRKQLAIAFPELDVVLVEEAWNARPQREYTPKTAKGRTRLAKLRGGVRTAPAGPVRPAEIRLQPYRPEPYRPEPYRPDPIRLQPYRPDPYRPFAPAGAP